MENRPHFMKRDGMVSWMVDGKPYLVLGGEVHNSSSSSLEHMEEIWAKAVSLGLNTLLVPVYWELVEPQEGCYDFSLPEQLILRARREGLRLIFLWFATWKNAASQYIPEWVKTDTKRFLRAQNADGRTLPTISCFSSECSERDGRALAALLAHVREMDAEGTLIGVQVENETGVLYSDRDYRPEATASFDQPLPAALRAYLLENRETLAPSLAAHICFDNLVGSWAQVFGPLAQEVFMAYYTGRYVGRVAALGKQAYDIPMFVNAWPGQCDGEPGGLHPSGGPTAQMHDIWRCASPSLDAFAADLYLENFALECKEYTRLPGNPLLIPEARPDKWVMAHAFYAVGEHNTLCFSPFGIEDVGHMKEVPPGAVIQGIFQTFSGIDTGDVIRETYSVLNNLKDMIFSHRAEGKVHGILQGRLVRQVVELTDYHAHISFANFIDRMKFPAGGLVLELGPNDFIFAGASYAVELVPKPGRPRYMEYLSIEEGTFVAGEWIRRRRLNGDELHPIMPDKPSILRIRVFHPETH